MPSALDVARYFLVQQDEEAGELITNLKLQKLVYYAQGFHLALYDRALFGEAIKAWAHGPVVPTLWHEYNRYGARPLPRPTSFDSGIFSEQQRELLDEVASVYGQFSAWKLRDMTHQEQPWIMAFDNGLGGAISEDSMRAFFSSRLVQ